MRIPAYRIHFGYCWWVQSNESTAFKVWSWWRFWLIKEVNVYEIDTRETTRSQHFPLGDEIVKEGSRWMYCKAVKDIKVGFVEDKEVRHA